MVVEHDMDFVASIAGKVTVLAEGRCWPRAACKCRRMNG
jgi:ABC-type uncharacterized transport system ATPase subunit